MTEGQIRFDKLVRDRIPEILALKGVAFEARPLDDAEFERELLKKAVEEAQELAAAEEWADMVKELADLEDVLAVIKELKGIDEAEVAAAKQEAFERKGGFTQRSFLLWSADDGYKKS